MNESNRLLIDWIESWPLFEWIARIVPNGYAQALLVLGLFIILAKIMDLVVVPVIKRWSRLTETTFDDELIGILRRPVFMSIILIGLGVTADILGFDGQVARITFSVLKTIAIFIWALFIVRFLRLILLYLSDDENRYQIVQERTLPLMNNLSVILVIGLATYFIFIAWRIDVTAWLASAGIIGIAISFAAKDTLANLFSGVFIVADAPYNIGDFIVLDTGERGMVTQIGIRSTRLLTRDDVEITVPNAVMGNAKITNEAGGPHEKFRIRVAVSVAYGSDIDQVRQILMEVATGDEMVCEVPEPRVRFRTFGDSGLNFELLCWVDKPVLRGRALDALNSEVYKRFQSEGVEIPYPKRDVYIKSQPGESS